MELDLAGAKWTSWPHAYGPARDTPEHLAALLGTDADAQVKAAQHFRSAIVHQSTVWPASPDAFGWLIRVLRNRPLPPNVLAGCLFALAEAGEHVPPDGTPIPSLSPTARRWLTRFGKANESRRDSLWEEALGGKLGDELWEWQTARLAALRPAVAALAAELSPVDAEPAEALAEVRSMWSCPQPG